MTNQLILDGIYLPEARRDRFSCWEEVVQRQIEMIDGSIVLEAMEPQPKIWRASYSFDYLGNDRLREILSVLRSGRPFPAAIQPDDRAEMISSMFVCDSLTPPTWAFSRQGVGLWHNLAFTLREERPHD